jgi:hypothetical protein
MPTTLPLELALQVVDIARFRRLDESAVQHLRRLTMIGLTCKAFYGVVERTTSSTMFATLSSNPDQDFVERTLAANRAGRPFETLYLDNEDGVDVGVSFSSMHGRNSVRKVVLLPNPSRGALVPLDSLSSDVLPGALVLPSPADGWADVNDDSAGVPSGLRRRPTPPTLTRVLHLAGTRR